MSNSCSFSLSFHYSLLHQIPTQCHMKFYDSQLQTTLARWRFCQKKKKKCEIEVASLYIASRT